MASNILVLTATPGMASALQRVLSKTSGNRPKVLATGGALFRHASPQEYHPRWKTWRIDDLPLLPEPRFRPRTGSGEKIREYKSVIARSDRVILAPPPDPPGLMDMQLLLDYAGIADPVTVWDTTSLQDEDVIHAIMHPRKDLDGWVQSEKARVHADWIIGLNGSRALTLYGRVSNPIPIGRVLSAMLSTFPVNPSVPTGSTMDAALLQARMLRAFRTPPKDTLILLQQAWERGGITYPFGSAGSIKLLGGRVADSLRAVFNGCGQREARRQIHLADWLESLRDISPWVQDPALKEQARHIQLGSARGRMNHLDQITRQGWMDPADFCLTRGGQAVYEKIPASLSDLGMVALWAQALDANTLEHGWKGPLSAFASWAEKYVVDLVSNIEKG